MSQRIFAVLSIAWILSACGDGGTKTLPPSPVADPPANPQDPPANPQDPPVSTQQPPVNPNQPPINPNQPPSNAGSPSASAAGGAPPVDDGNNGRAGSGPPGPGNRCTQPNGCTCANVCDACKCALGNNDATCAQVCN